MVPVHQPNVFDFGVGRDRFGCALDRKVLHHHHVVPVVQRVSVGINDSLFLSLFLGQRLSISDVAAFGTIHPCALRGRKRGAALGAGRIGIHVQGFGLVDKVSRGRWM